MPRTRDRLRRRSHPGWIPPRDDRSLALLRAHGGGTFEPPAEVAETVPSRVVAADLDVDGALDLVA